MPLYIVCNDLTAMTVDAIVNTANPYPVIGNGTDRAIHAKAGSGLLEARRKIGAIAAGQAAVTPAFNLDADFVIHTVGPVWIDGSHNEEKTLAGCYRNSLKLAWKNGCQSVAFPLISTGTYNFPKDRALHIAVTTISQFILENEMTVYLVVYDKNSYRLSEKLLGAVESYIDENYVEQQKDVEYPSNVSSSRRIYDDIRYRQSADFYKKAAMTSVNFSDVEADFSAVDTDICEMKSVCANIPFDQTDWDKVLKGADKGFSETLLEMIEAKGMTNAQAYNKANIDKKHFHKIKNNKNYQPTKYTVLAFAIALELDTEQTKALMEKAGLALTKSNRFDLIVSFFIEHKRYNVFELNEVLFEYDLPLIGC